MFQRLSTDTFNWILITGVILLVIEMAFFHGGMIVSAAISGILVYIGWKNFQQLWGKILFWLGIVWLIFAILNMLAVRFLILAAIILFLINYSKSKQEAEHLNPEFPQDVVNVDQVVRLKPLFDHNVFGDQETSDTSYQWRDINIHGVFGDRIIDLSNTVLPDDTSVISIRHMIGNIVIYVPYDVELSIHHSSIFGRAQIMGEHHWKLMNQSILYQTENYDTALPRVKVVTSLLSGDIEVKRI